MIKIKTIKIFDTTLRDGEQSPGASLTVQEKLVIAKQLEKLNVDIIEAGFPIASKGDFLAVNKIAKEVKTPSICALARAKIQDIERAWEAVKPATHPRIHVFIATSQIHIEHKLRKSKETIISLTQEAVLHAKQYTEDIEFSPEDASRTDIAYMCDVVRAAIKAGATTINIPDTVGYAQPKEFGQRIKYLLKKVNGAKISVHCHNDLGLAVANSLSGVENGASQVECTINGLGERAGNASLEEVVMNLETRKDYFAAKTNINKKEIFNTSKLVSRLTGINVQRNKAIVGMNAFAHEAGIHQHGVLSHKRTYEIMTPESVGWIGENIVIGKHSGRHAVEKVLKESGYDITKMQLDSITKKIKHLADRQKEIAKDDVFAIARDVVGALSEEEEHIKLDELSVVTGNRITPSATVGLIINNKKELGTATGVGPVDAASNAIRAIIGPSLLLQEYHLKAITGGTDALCSVAIKVEDDNHAIYSAEAVDEDIIMASVKALLKGANKALHEQRSGDQI